LEAWIAHSSSGSRSRIAFSAASGKAADAGINRVNGAPANSPEQVIADLFQAQGFLTRSGTSAARVRRFRPTRSGA
jgi:hypothetical protein